jgi:hypothetical protein
MIRSAHVSSDREGVGKFLMGSSASVWREAPEGEESWSHSAVYGIGRDIFRAMRFMKAAQP